jgi:ribosomal protein S27E
MKEDFKELKDLLENLHQSLTDDKCNFCNTTINWAEKQFKRNCPKCGRTLIRSGCVPKKKVNCWLCFDTGFVNYKCQIDGLPYTHEGGACPECEAGQNVKNDYIPWVQDTLYAPPLESIKRYNKQIGGFKEA